MRVTLLRTPPHTDSQTMQHRLKLAHANAARARVCPRYAPEGQQVAPLL